MTGRHVYKLNLDTVKQPEDLWARLFLAWLKNLGEVDAMTLERLDALADAITQLDGAIAKLLSERPDDLVAAMRALQDVQEIWKQQSTRSLDNVEKIAVIARQIAASQETG